MPNNFVHDVSVLGPNEELKAFLEHFNKNEDLDFQTIIPMPAILFGTVAGSFTNYRNFLAAKEVGHSNWYDWRLEHWGTKWNAYDCTLLIVPKSDVDSSEINRLRFQFTTAWSFPVPIFNRLAELHPSCVFEVKSVCEGGGKVDLRFSKGLTDDQLKQATTYE